MGITFRDAIAGGKVRAKKFYSVNDILLATKGRISLPAELNYLTAKFTIIDLEVDKFANTAQVTEIAFIKCSLEYGVLRFEEKHIGNLDGEGRVEALKCFEESLQAGGLFVSHNSEFDKRSIKNYLGVNHERWFCTLSGISWESYGYNGKSLEYLLFKSRLFYDAHNALADAQALLALLVTHPYELVNITSRRRRVTVKNIQGAQVELLASMGYSIDLKVNKATVFVDSEMVDAEVCNLTQLHINSASIKVS